MIMIKESNAGGTTITAERDGDVVEVYFDNDGRFINIDVTISIAANTSTSTIGGVNLSSNDNVSSSDYI